jgi:hypothetical protein
MLLINWEIIHKPFFYYDNAKATDPFVYYDKALAIDPNNIDAIKGKQQVLAALNQTK